MKIFVGNLSFDATQADIRTLFEGFGSVSDVVIVTEKKETKSRGFGFVDMTDDLQATAAIEALNGKEFMGRPLNVGAARSKGVSHKTGKPKTEKRFPHAKQDMPYRAKPQEDRGDRHSNPFERNGGYKAGRRTLSYMKRQGLSEIDRESGRSKSHDNPGAWKKKQDQSSPWKKFSGASKPWKKSAGEFRPWKKPREGFSKPWLKKEGDSVKPWKKSPGEGDSKPWEKSSGASKPWQKREGAIRPWDKSKEGSGKPWLKKDTEDAKPWKKFSGETKPWKKDEGESKPWKKSMGSSKPWHKAGDHGPHRSFKSFKKGKP